MSRLLFIAFNTGGQSIQDPDKPGQPAAVPFHNERSAFPERTSGNMARLPGGFYSTSPQNGLVPYPLVIGESGTFPPSLM